MKFYNNFINFLKSWVISYNDYICNELLLAIKKTLNRFKRIRLYIEVPYAGKLSKSYFNVSLIDQPRLVTDKLIEFTQVFQLLWYVCQTEQPGLLTLLWNELGLLLIHQVEALVPRRCHDRNVMSQLIGQCALRIHQIVVELDVLIEKIGMEGHDTDHIVYMTVVSIVLCEDLLDCFVIIDDFFFIPDNLQIWEVYFFIMKYFKWFEIIIQVILFKAYHNFLPKFV